MSLRQGPARARPIPPTMEPIAIPFEFLPLLYVSLRLHVYTYDNAVSLVKNFVTFDLIGLLWHYLATATENGDHVTERGLDKLLLGLGAQLEAAEKRAEEEAANDLALSLTQDSVMADVLTRAARRDHPRRWWGKTDCRSGGLGLSLDRRTAPADPPTRPGRRQA